MSNPWDALISTLGNDLAAVEQEMTNLLSANGLSHLAGEMPQVYQVLQRLGVADPLSAIGEAIAELVSKGPQALIEEKLTEYLRPLTDPIKAWRPSQTAVSAALQAHPTSIHMTVQQCDRS